MAQGGKDSGRYVAPVRRGLGPSSGSGPDMVQFELYMRISILSAQNSDSMATRIRPDVVPVPQSVYATIPESPGHYISRNLIEEDLEAKTTGLYGKDVPILSGAKYSSMPMIHDMLDYRSSRAKRYLL